jgi:hypothetical protein
MHSSQPLLQQHQLQQSLHGSTALGNLARCMWKYHPYLLQTGMLVRIKVNTVLRQASNGLGAAHGNHCDLCVYWTDACMALIMDCQCAAHTLELRA